MFCVKCGTQLPERSRFCYKCGYRVENPLSAHASSANLDLECKHYERTYQTDEHDVTPQSTVTEKELLKVFYEAAQFETKDDYYSELKVLMEYKEKAWNNPSFLVKLGRSYRRCHMLVEALECYNRVLELNPNEATAYSNMGAVYLAAGNFQKAIPLYERGIRIMEANRVEYTQSDYATVLANYGGALAGVGRKTEGESFLKKAEALGYADGKTIRKMFHIHASQCLFGRFLNRFYIGESTQ